MNLGALALGLACLGVSIGEGLLVSSYISSSARQPEMQSKLMSCVSWVLPLSRELSSSLWL